jgi:hypothetical protein
MNPRIRELAKQSGTWEYYEFNEGVGEDEKHLEKFALLIVQECANLFAVEWGEEKLTGNDVGYVVKKHFGVQ